MIQKITTSTNKMITKLRPRFSRERDARYTDTIEIKAVLGLPYMAGINNASHSRISDLWKTDGTGIEFFRVIMNDKRFGFLLRALRFDDKDSRPERQEHDKLAAIREILDLFNENIAANYIPGKFLTVDEMLEPFRGRCGFRQYIPNKPAKYGLKLFGICDAKTFYTSKVEMYCGVQPEGPYRQSNKPEEVVLRLANAFVGTKRTITMDDWLTSLELAEKLKMKELSLVGTVRKNKRLIPPFFLAKVPGRPIRSSMFGFNEMGTLVSYYNKNRKFVPLLSTMEEHTSTDVNEADPERRPEIILQYIATKGGIDQVDRLKTMYSVGRISRRWPLTLFFGLMNIGAINSYILYRKNTAAQVTRKNYLKTLAMTLCKEHARNRLTELQTPKAIKDKVKEIYPVPEEDMPSQAVRAPQEEEEGLCYLCDTHLNRKSKTRCISCENSICMKDHRRPLCTNCVPPRFQP